MSTRVSDLSINGGTPIRDADDPLPEAMPQEVNPKAKEYYAEFVDKDLQVDFLGRFEREFARVMGAKHAIGIVNCTSACHTALAAAGVGPSVVRTDRFWDPTGIPDRRYS